MTRILILLSVFIFLSGHSLCQYKTSIRKIYSKNVKDSFEIYISIPKDYSKSKIYDPVYYCDANLKSGKKLRELISGGNDLPKSRSSIFIGIGHIGNFHELRRRDFITPSINNGDTIPDSKNYGHVKDFYQFLTIELMPYIERSYKLTSKRAIIGHSLGGLFVFYCLFQNEAFFTNYIALSPALWIDHYDIYKFNKIKNSLQIPSYLYLSTGSLETFNYIRAGTSEMNSFLKEKKYKNLQWEYQIHSYKTHNSQLPVSLSYILKKI